MKGHLIHVSMTKPLLLMLLRNEGAQKVLVGWKGTDAEAYHAIATDPRKAFVLDRCDNQRPDGSCGGHDL